MSVFETSSARAGSRDRFRAPAGPATPAGRGGPPYRIPVAPLTDFYDAGNPDGPFTDGDPDGPDGSGSGGGDDCRCGPEVTAWFKRQLPILKRYADQNRTAGLPDEVLRKMIAALKFENACLFIEDCCPRCAACERTVTLCGTCINVTELGNLAYGYMLSNDLALMLWGGLYAAVQAPPGEEQPRGFDQYPDIVAAIAGAALWHSWTFNQRKTFCESLRAPAGPQFRQGPPDLDDIFYRMNEYNAARKAQTIFGSQQDVLREWDVKHGAKFGGWQNFVRTALGRADRNGGLLAYLGRLTDDACGSCDEVVDPGDIVIRTDGTPTLNGRPLTEKCPRDQE